MVPGLDQIDTVRSARAFARNAQLWCVAYAESKKKRAEEEDILEQARGLRSGSSGRHADEIRLETRSIRTSLAKATVSLPQFSRQTGSLTEGRGPSCADQGVWQVSRGGRNRSRLRPDNLQRRRSRNIAGQLSGFYGENSVKEVDEKARSRAESGAARQSSELPVAQPRARSLAR